MPFDVTLKNVRRELKMTQEQLAQDLNVSFSTLSRWENNHNTPSRLARMRILEYCSQKNVSAAIVAELKEMK